MVFSSGAQKNINCPYFSPIRVYFDAAISCDWDFKSIFTEARQRSGIYMLPRHQIGSLIIFINLHWLIAKSHYRVTSDLQFCFLHFILSIRSSLARLGIPLYGSDYLATPHRTSIITAQHSRLEACRPRDVYISLPQVPRLECCHFSVPVKRYLLSHFLFSLEKFVI